MSDEPTYGEGSQDEHAQEGQEFAEESSEAEEKLLKRLQEEMRRMTVSDHLAQMLVYLSGKAFQHLGVTEDTAEDRDAEQSRLAIEAYKAILEVIAPMLPDDQVTWYRSTLSQMQLAYATHAAGAGGGGGGEADQENGDGEDEQGGTG